MGSLAAAVAGGKQGLGCCRDSALSPIPAFQPSIDLNRVRIPREIRDPSRGAGRASASVWVWGGGQDQQPLEPGTGRKRQPHQLWLGPRAGAPPQKEALAQLV